VLDDVERRRFLVDPAREDAAPALVRALDIDLDEGSGELLLLPRRGRFARAQTHQQIFPSRRLARVERDILHDAVALVEDAEDGDALRHRSDSALARRGRRRLFGRLNGRVLLFPASPARSEGKRKQPGGAMLLHFYSGIQGS
jgi:hypothetical protein